MLFRSALLALVVLGTLGSLPSPAAAQSGSAQPAPESSAEATELTLQARLQARASYGWEGPLSERTDRLGAGIRRVRLIAAATSGSARVQIQLAGASSAAFVLDAFGAYQLTPQLRVRAGRIASAQPRSLIRTGLPYIDAVSRAAIAERWGRGTVGGDGRDFGVELRWRQRLAELLLFVHNGDGSWNRVRGNYRDEISGGSVADTASRAALAVTAAATLHPPALPGLELGGFAGYNGSRNPNTAVDGVGRTYATYGAHLYWGARPGSQTVRLKADLLGIRYASIAERRGGAQYVLGLAGLAAVRPFRATEVFARAEAYDPDVGRDGRTRFLAAGLTMSPSAWRGGPFDRERVSLAYNLQAPDQGEALHLIVCQFQWIF